MEQFPPLSKNFLRREHKHLETLFSFLTEIDSPKDLKKFKRIQRKKNKEDFSPEIGHDKHFFKDNEDLSPSPEESVRITTHFLKFCNNYKLDEFGNAKIRKNELDENGEPAFLLSHEIKVALHCFENMPSPDELQTLSENEQKILKEVQENPYETTVTTFLHDFVEDNFNGDFNTVDPKTGKSVGELIQDELRRTSLKIPLPAQKRIFARLLLLTKPPERYPKEDSVSFLAKTNLYLDEYRNYCLKLIKEDDAICTYIKFWDIFHNAQSHKEISGKTLGKKFFQHDFLKSALPEYLQLVLKKNIPLVNSIQNSGDSFFLKLIQDTKHKALGSFDVKEIPNREA